MAQIVRVYCHGQVQTVDFPTLKPKVQDVSQVGVLLRPEVLEATTQSPCATSE